MTVNSIGTLNTLLVDCATGQPAFATVADDFESYSVGFLAGSNGGSGWVTPWSTTLNDFDVVAASCFQGAKCIKSAVFPGAHIVRNFSGLNTGFAIFAAKKINTGGTHYVALANSGGSAVALIRWDGDTEPSPFPGHIAIQDGPANRQIVAPTNHGIWQSVEVQFGGKGGVCSVTQYRARADGGAWSACANQVVSGPIVGVGVSSDTGNTREFWIDDITIDD